MGLKVVKVLKLVSVTGINKQSFLPVKKLSSSQTVRGFTLIELLVVIAIIGILASLLLLSIKSVERQSPTDKWISQIDQKIAYALDAAVLRNHNYGLQFNNRNIDFFILQKDGWKIHDKEPLSSQSFPENTSHSLYVEGEPYLETDDEEVTPDIIIDTIGTITPFEIHLHENAQTYILKYNLSGKVDDET
jgi:general secretion pathway protein H